MYYDLPLVDDDPFSRAYERRLIEHGGLLLGFIVEKPHGYIVYAYAHEIWPLDRRVFPTWAAAEREMVVSASRSSIGT